MAVQKKRSGNWSVAVVLASRWFWWSMLGLFVLQAVYIACVGRFSMAFDEHFHLAAIQQYATVLFPWQVTQPPGPAELSAFTADGSYLYHYLLSFPYRLMQVFTSSVTTQIVLLRLLDVGIVVVGWGVFRRLLGELGMSRAATHSIVALCMLMPMAPFMAGQLTYDALFFTLCGVSLLAMVRLLKTIYEQQKLPLGLSAWTATAVLVTLQTKYAFFPAALGAAAYTAGLIAWLLYKKRLDVRRVWQSWCRSSTTAGGLLAVGFLLLASALFVQRYGVNYVKYGSLVPECQVVLGHERCLGFAPYGRDAEIRKNGWHQTITPQQKRGYTKVWYDKMIYESYFTIGPKQIDYPIGEPLTLPYTAGKLLAACSVLAIVVGGLWACRRSVFWQFSLTVLATYVVFLYARNYQAFLATAVPLSIHGRYVLPFLPLAGYVVYESVRPVLRVAQLRSVASVVVVCVLAAHLWGGGVAAYIVRSQDTWYWQSAQPTSRIVRNLVRSFVLQ
jgi:hypothetical protein